ncbi:MAG: VWA domain-containing protein [Phycisphaerae bacterium]
MLRIALSAFIVSSVVSMCLAEAWEIKGKSEVKVMKTRPTPHDPKASTAPVPVDIVICLDTSGSMTALIDSARAQLWEIVNEFAQAKPVPVLRVGLLTYGSPNNSNAANGWVVRQIGLSSDLDAVYAKMMGMTTNGGEEFVGWVLNDAIRTMDWSTDPRALKVVYVAGNESADQGSATFNFRSVGLEARERDILINAIYAGNASQGMAESWNQVASHGNGEYAAIDMSAGLRQRYTQYDDILIQLNTQLNATYIPYGRQGAQMRLRQEAQDAQACQLGKQTAASRSAAKGSVLYDNAHWDLVDASKDKKFEVSSVPVSQLPDAMQLMSEDERVKYLEQARQKRSKLQKKIQEVQLKRLAELRKQEENDESTEGLGRATKRTIRSQAKSKKIIIP